mmetsp:Transcript_97530/g.262024  ORF Transcript_97530/g.262024 Transcript_97530/m.262024 type:complete len:112 (+) Transcript_97530:93-428(+)
MASWCLALARLLLVSSLALEAAATRLRAAGGERQPGGITVNGYEYGDREANVRTNDVSDYSVHQFLVADDARDGPSSSSDDTNVAAKERRARAVASQDHFNSENTPAAEDD